MVSDGLTQRLFGQPYDPDGKLASIGQPSQRLLEELCNQDVYLTVKPPKSTGRERYGGEFIDALAEKGAREGLSSHELLATATAFTAVSIARAYREFIAPKHPVENLIVSGGGVRNRFLMNQLAIELHPVKVVTSDDFGLDAEKKEALCFAVLAHETLNGTPTNLPSCTGASRATLLGKICVPLGER
jgi:anhydro-N-acetylmuramic acid kinase